MKNSGTSKGKNDFLALIIIFIIISMILGAVFAGRFFTSENKLKIAFENGQTISFFVAVHDETRLIEKVAVIFFNTRTNRIGMVFFLPKTYIPFGRKHGYLTLESILQKKIDNAAIRNGVEKFLDAPIDYYIYIQKKNFVRFIDMMGGVEVYSNEIRVPEKNIYIPNGVTLLDGDKSEEFLNILQKDENEYDPLKRYANYTRGLFRMKDNFLESYTTDIVANYFYRLFQTDLSVNDLLIIYNQLKERFNGGITDLARNKIDIFVYCDKKDLGKGEYIYMPKKNGSWARSEIKDALTRITKKDITVEENKIVVQILNGTDIVGFASRTKPYLESYGFDVYDIGNAPTEDYKHTVILIRKSEPKALKLADLIKCKRVSRVESSSDDKIDVTVILGRDFDGKVVRR